MTLILNGTPLGGNNLIVYRGRPDEVRVGSWRSNQKLVKIDRNEIIFKLSQAEKPARRFLSMLLLIIAEPYLFCLTLSERNCEIVAEIIR